MCHVCDMFCSPCYKVLPRFLSSSKLPQICCFNSQSCWLEQKWKKYLDRWRKSLKYTDQTAEAEQCSWRTQVLPVELGCRGVVATSSAMLLRSVRVRGQVFWQAIKSLSETAERSSDWLWSTDVHMSLLQKQLNNYKPRSTPILLVTILAGVVSVCNNLSYWAHCATAGKKLTCAHIYLQHQEAFQCPLISGVWRAWN